MLFEKNDAANTRGGWSRPPSESEEVFNSIEHERDHVVLDGTLAQNFNFLIYDTERQTEDSSDVFQSHVSVVVNADTDTRDLTETKHEAATAASITVPMNTANDPYALPALPPSIFDDIAMHSEGHMEAQDTVLTQADDSLRL